MAKEESEIIKNKIKDLHNIAAKMESALSEEELYEMVIDAAEDVLEFYVCTIFIQEDDDVLEIKATLADELEMGQELPLRDSIYTKTFINNRSYLIGNVDEVKGAKPTDTRYKSAISVPIGDIGVFQAISDNVDHFDEYDLELAELLVSHLTETLKRIKNEKTVRESEKRYKAIFNNTGTAKIIVSEELDINTVNNEFEELSGYNKNELEGHMKFNDFLYESDVEELKRIVDHIQKETKDISKKVELKFIDKFGNLKDTIGAISDIPHSNEFNLSLLDITDFKVAVDELQKVEKKYQTIFEKSETAMLIISKDTVIEMVNPKFVEMFGYKKKEVEGKKSWTELVVEDYLPKMEKYHEKRRKDPDSVPSSYECEVYDSSGNKRRVLLNVGMIPETDKSLVSVVDLSRKGKFIELDTIFAEADTAMFITNSDMEIIKVNDALLGIFGYEENDLLGTDFNETVFSGFKSIFEEMIKDDIIFKSQRMEVSTTGGEELNVGLNSSLIKKEDEEDYYILTIIYK